MSNTSLNNPFGSAAILLCAVGLAAAAAPAQAKYVEADYSGVVLGFAPGESLAGVNTGDSFSYKVVYNDATFVDHTASANAAIAAAGGTVLFSSFLTADLSADPRASLTISIGNVIFTKFDALGYGTPEEGGPPDLGGGNLPGVEYINGQFAGVSGLFVNDTYFLQQDPIAYDEGFISYPFLLGTLDPLGYVLAGAYPAPGGFSIHAVPEPATWAMMLLGFGGLGTVLRCRRRRVGRTLNDSKCRRLRPPTMELSEQKFAGRSRTPVRAIG